MNEDSSELAASSNTLKLTPEPERIPININDIEGGYEKVVLKQIETDIENIKNKLISLSGKNVNKIVNRTVLEIILPKEVIKKQKLNNTEKRYSTIEKCICIGERSNKLIKPKQGSLFSSTEEIVKKLSLYENFDSIKAIIKTDGELNNRLIKDDCDFKPQIPNFRLESMLNTKINRGLNKINLTIKNSKLNFLMINENIKKKSKKELIMIKEDSQIESSPDKTMTRESNSNRESMLIKNSTLHTTKYNNTTRFQTMSSVGNGKLSSIKLPQLEHSSTTLNSKVAFPSIKINKETKKSRTNIKTRNLKAKTIEDNNNLSFTTENSEIEQEEGSHQNFQTGSSISVIAKKAAKSNELNNEHEMEHKLNDSVIFENIDNININTLKTLNSNETEIVWKQSNVVFEEKLESKLAKLRTLLTTMKEKYNYLCFGLERTNRRLEEMNLERDAIAGLLSKSKKEYDKEETLKSQPTIKTTKFVSIKLSVSNNDTSEEALIAKSQKKALLRRMEEQEKLLNKEIKNANFIRSSFKQDIHRAECQMETCKKEITKFKRRLLMHYHELLSEGKDTRNQGLTWIMLAIWKLGCEVFMSYMPKFLDSQLISYFFLRSHKEIELSKVQSLLTELRELVRIFRGKEYRKQKKSKTKIFPKSQVSYIISTPS